MENCKYVDSGLHYTGPVGTDILAQDPHILALASHTRANLPDHPGYTHPAPLLPAPCPSTDVSGARLAMRLGMEPFTRQVQTLQ